MKSENESVVYLHTAIAKEKCSAHIKLRWNTAPLTSQNIWRDVNGALDILVFGANTQKALIEEVQTLKTDNPKLKLIAVELIQRPSPLEEHLGIIWETALSHPIEQAIKDETIQIVAIFNDEAVVCGRHLAEAEQLPSDIETAALIWAAIQIGKRPENTGKNILILQPDDGDCIL